MDLNTLLIVLVAAILAQKPAPACNTIAGTKPAVPDVVLNEPSALSSADKGRLATLAGFMRQHNCRIVVQGFTDVAGKDRQDDRARAQSIMDYLTRELPEAQRVRLNQVTIEAKGVLNPAKRQQPTKIARVVP